jgi:PAS domain S-box-containing protein
MSILFTLINTSPYIDFSKGLVGAAGWVVFLGVNLFLLQQTRGYQKSRSPRFWGIFLGLAVCVPAASLFLGLRLSSQGALPPPGLPVDPRGPALMVFAALPWVLAAGLQGPVSAAVLAGLSGLLIALWDTHNPFTPLEYVFLAILFSAAVNQRYRTFLYRALSHPLIAAFILALLYPLIFMVNTTLSASGILANRLDYALTHVAAASLSVGVGLLIAGLFAEVIAYAFPAAWASSAPLRPSPAERSLEARFLYGMAPLALLLILTLMIGDWIVAGNAARKMMRDRMANSAQMAAEDVPYFLEVGQNLIVQLASDPRLYQSNPNQLKDLLAQDLRSVPFFHQIYVLDANGNSLAGYPQDNYATSKTPPEEQVGVQLALNGVPFQVYAAPPLEGGKTAQVSFMASVVDSVETSGKPVKGVMVGRADLSANPFTQPVLAGLKSLSGEGGNGLLIDENGQILYGPDPELLMTLYSGQKTAQADFFDQTAPDGTRQLVYYQPVEGRPWAVVMTVPAQRAQQLALNIAAPLLGMIILLSFIAVLLVRLGLRVVTGSLQKLAGETERISQGQLDHPLSMDGEDEVGQLGRSFEQMRISLKARLDELNRLLLVSQGVASSLEIEEAVKPVLDSALRTGASSARVVLSPAVVPELEGDGVAPISFGAGPASELFSDLDEQILGLTRQQDRILLTSLSRARLLKFAPNSPKPGALLAFALRHENLYYGTLWVAYDQPHQFPDEEVRFIATLAGQAALAAANARLFLNAEIGRQRLAAILASTPDPVLVTDQQNRLLLANPAAWRVLGLGIEWDEGQPIEHVINQEELLSLFHSTMDEKKSVELALPDERVYYATISPVFAEGQRVGRVCVLRDITYFKDLDALKSEFVATVSHDLRSPLTLMRGYATMLEMVGELNEQQNSYVHKIVGSVESMARLVSNLLDLGRIEAGIDLQLEMVPIQEIVERVIGALQLQATQKRVQLSMEIPENTIPLVEADPALLQQALHNLVENSIKYTDAGGKAQVRVDVRQDRMQFIVSDTGIGIAPVDQPHLFEKFYRGAQQGSKQQRGTGLGLAIVKSIAERHGGQVWVESQLGKGSIFTMAIPLRQPKGKTEKVKREA